MKIDLERKAFEEWFEADAMPLEHSNWFGVDSDGDCEFDFVREAWRGWLARAELGDEYLASKFERPTAARIAAPYKPS